MEKTYNPHAIEQDIYQQWEHSGFFAPTGNGKPYCIVIPPPNVTGSLHMGHGFQLSLMDALTRYHRMLGDKTLWQLGTDHAGIATQMVVERQLLAEGSDRHKIGREEFVKLIWQWKEYSGDTIGKQQRRLGISGDWQRSRFTLDPGLVKAVHKVFIELYQEGIIYRGQRLVNWDPTLRTAISELEVINEEQNGSIWQIRYPLCDDKNKFIEVATTRPETIFGDAAIAVHPEDERYKNLIGKCVHLPLTDRTIPIIADEYVDREFGTGCVKITPAHDFNDYAVGKRHNLPLINIFTPDAHLNENTPEIYHGMERFAARRKILENLNTVGLLVAELPHKLTIPKGDRSGAVIEPYLTYQWFVKAKILAEPAIAAVKQGKIKFVPENWSKTYFQWLENIEDWCISRQIWWGHRIPAWYDKNNNVYVGEDAANIRKQYNLPESIELTQDPDVLDTWFSSALWPFSSLGWPEKTEDLKTFYPTNVLVTGFDIIFFWVARMIMMGLKFTGQVPFHEVYITGLIRDGKGQKMSKSKGNVLDPIDLIDGINLEDLVAKRTSNLMQPALAKQIAANTKKEFPDGIPAFGTDALRLTFCSLATLGKDINFDITRLESYRNFCNKLWNAARYVLMQTESFSYDNAAIKNLKYNSIDCWIISKFNLFAKEIQKLFSNYRFDLIAQNIYDFIWHEYCDWYLELSKVVLTGAAFSENEKYATRYTLLNVLEQTLRLIHPIIPFISEKIWQQIAPKININASSIMIQTYPQFAAYQIDNAALQDIEWLKKIILGVRNIRGEMNISPNKLLPLLLHKGTEHDREKIIEYQEYLNNLLKLESITWTKQPPPSATSLVETLELNIPLAGLIDKDAEIARLNKEISKLQKDLTSAETKLNNPNYAAKAPQDVVEKEKQKINDLGFALKKLQLKLDILQQMTA